MILKVCLVTELVILLSGLRCVLHIEQFGLVQRTQLTEGGLEEMIEEEGDEDD